MRWLSRCLRGAWLQFVAFWVNQTQIHIMGPFTASECELDSDIANRYNVLYIVQRNYLSPIHTNDKRKRKWKFSLMFVVYSLISFRFHFHFYWVNETLNKFPFAFIRRKWTLTECVSTARRFDDLKYLDHAHANLDRSRQNLLRLCDWSHDW